MTSAEMAENSQPDGLEKGRKLDGEKVEDEEREK